MLIGRLISHLRTIITVLCLLALVLVLQSTTEQASAASVVAQTTTHASMSGRYDSCLLLQVRLHGNQPAQKQCLLTRRNVYRFSPKSLVQRCNDHLVMPWVALYWDANFGEPSICFIGRGQVSLYDYAGYPGVNWVDQVSSINIGANGVFFDQNLFIGNQFPFSYGLQISNLTWTGWNDRIAFLRIDS